MTLIDYLPFFLCIALVGCLLGVILLFEQMFKPLPQYPINSFYYDEQGNFKCPTPTTLITSINT